MNSPRNLLSTQHSALSTFPRSVWLFAVLLAVLTSLPYLVGAISAPSGWQYTGAAPVPGGFHVDYYSHLAKMQQGYRGQWAYQLLFTSEPHGGLPLVQGFYVLLGALTRLTPFSLSVVYHLARFLLTIGVVLAVWRFAARFFDTDRERWLCVFFGTLLAGWSWLLLFIAPGLTSQVAPIEFWLTDAFTVLGIFFMPHFAAAILLQIVAFLALDTWFHQPHAFKPLLVLTLALSAESLIQPYVILLTLPLIVSLAARQVWVTRAVSVRRAAWLLLPLGLHAALVAYQYLAISGDPVWANFTAQNITASPDPRYYLLGYLPWILPIAWGARRFMLDRAADIWWLPILWGLLVAVLIYAPFPTQRRYLLGVQTPLAVLAVYGWTRAVLPRFSPARGRLVTLIYITLSAVAPLGLLLGNVSALTKPPANLAVFDRPDELAGYDWLRRNAAPDEVLLTTFDWAGEGSGGKLVAATGERVFIGHWIETVDFDQKIAQVKKFYSPITPDDWRRSFLHNSHIVYLWYDATARVLGDWQPSTADYAQPVFESATVTVYKVMVK